MVSEWSIAKKHSLNTGKLINPKMKMNFKYFQIEKWMLQTVREEKVDKKLRPRVWFHVLFVSCGPMIV